MGQDKDQERRILTCFRQIGHGHNVARQRNARQILDVFMSCVDDMGQLGHCGTALVVRVVDFDHFFIDPHVDVTFKVLRQPFTIQADFRRNGTSPIS